MATANESVCPHLPARVPVTTVLKSAAGSAGQLPLLPCSKSGTACRLPPPCKGTVLCARCVQCCLKACSACVQCHCQTVRSCLPGHTKAGQPVPCQSCRRHCHRVPPPAQRPQINVWREGSWNRQLPVWNPVCQGICQMKVLSVKVQSKSIVSILLSQSHPLHPHRLTPSRITPPPGLTA